MQVKPAIYQDKSQTVEARISDLLKHMSLAEKIGQMTQVEKNSITPDDAKAHCIGVWHYPSLAERKNVR